MPIPTDLYAGIANAWMATAIVLRPSLPRRETWRAETLAALLEHNAGRRKSKARDKDLCDGLSAFFAQSEDFSSMSLNLIFLSTLTQQMLPEAPHPTPATAAQSLASLLQAIRPG